MQWELSRLSSIATVVNGYPFDSQFVGKEKEHLWCGFAIDHLREDLTRLIADVVTGKLDVHEAAAELPEVDWLAEDDLAGTIHDRKNSNLGELDAEESAEEYTIKKEMPL